MMRAFFFDLRFLRAFLLGGALVLATAAPQAALAQTAGASREGPTGLVTPGGDTRRFPSIFGTASAFPSPGGTGFVGLNYVNPRGGISGEGSDGDFGAGYTIGNPVENVSLTFGLSITSLKDFGADGSLSLSAARALVVGERSLTFVGATASNLAAWGDARLNPEAYSIYVSRLSAIPLAGGELPIQLSAGYGDRITLSDDGLGRIDDGAFIGLGVGVSPNLSVSLSATETQLNAGIGFGIPEFPNLSIGMGVFDVTDNVERRQFSLSVSLGF
ncbi:MAG: hypothetical protein AAFQ06_04960 [Pseudomonadota bacterium]